MFMPDNRPNNLKHFVSHRVQYLEEVKKLQRGIVLVPNGSPTRLSLDEVINYIAAGGLVEPHQLAVGRMTRGRLLVILPENMDRDQAIRAIPQWVWDIGYTVEAWSQLADATIAVPRFKLWVDLIGVPLECMHEDEIAGAVAHFGTYLGTLEPEGSGELSIWSVVPAASDLALVAKIVSFMIGGLETVVTLRVRRWTYAPVYTALDLPQPPPKYKQPREDHRIPQVISSDIEALTMAFKRPRWFAEEEVIPMSLKALREVYRG
jgi:hypothetical protein